jgi:two-component system sensor histidine kinase HydH
MALRFALNWQILIVAILFLGSLITLLSSNVAALSLPEREAEARQRLSEASLRLAQRAAPLLDELGDKKPKPDWHQRLTMITRDVLIDLQGVEGGFYFGGDRNEFTGYAYPNDPHPPPEPPLPPPKVGPKGKNGKDKDKGGPGPAPYSREPPPREKDLILTQCLTSLTLDADAPPVVHVVDVPPSRVMIVTQPVGQARPARMAAWVMVRLRSPEQQAIDLRRYQLSAALALIGILLSLVLTANLGRNLRLERRQRERLREELRRSEHLATLGKLLAGVAHEVRNPLAGIRSTAQLWQRLPEQGRTPEAAEPILRAVDRLNNLVSRLLYFARTGYDERRPVDLNGLVRETLSLLRAQAESQRVVFREELAPALPPLLGSAQALQQVVLNLTMNALQALPQGGTLCCRTRAVDGPSRIELCVADTGPGIAPADRPHLFEPFHTTRPDGTGLGLALCREIVQQHGGHIQLDEEPGWGAVFRVTLPVGARGGEGEGS